jgi:hypothetical protein
MLHRATTTNLTFTDGDLTDQYRDERSSSALSSSTHGNRHPRGDTPSVGQREPRGGEHSVGTSRGGSTNEGATTREMPSLDKLMAFLDEDDDHEELQPPGTTPRPNRSIGTSSPRRLHSTRTRHDSPSTRTRNGIPPSSTPPPPSRSQPPSASASSTSHASSTSPSPSIRARSNSHRAQSQSANSSYRHQQPAAAAPSVDPHSLRGNRGGNYIGQPDGDALPISPSPKPGSMATLRRSLSASEFIRDVEGGVVASIGDSKRKGRSVLDEGAREEEEHPDSQDSVAVLADQVRSPLSLAFLFASLQHTLLILCFGP